MTNEDFIRMSLTEQDIARLMLYGERPDSEVIQNAKKVFYYWASFGFKKCGNAGGKEKFSIWNFTHWHNSKTGQSEKIGRNLILSRKVWLSLPYKKEEWCNAIQKYNSKWGI